MYIVVAGAAEACVVVIWQLSFHIECEGGILINTVAISNGRFCQVPNTVHHPKETKTS